MERGPFHTKHRPNTLEQVIGHSRIVTRLQGIIKSKRYPNALLFVGPSSAGKTTLARCFANEVYGTTSLQGNPDYTEINAADSRGIDDVRSLLKVAALKPMRGKLRIIVVDECQQLTGPAAQVLLRPLENPAEKTMFIFCSMEPEKLLQAIRNRCTQFVLEAPEKEDLVKYVKRIAKREKVTYLTDEVINEVVQNSNGVFRDAANILEAVVQYVEGTGEKPKDLMAAVTEALSSVDVEDDLLASQVLLSLYSAKFSNAQRKLLDVQDTFRFINTLLRLNTFLLNTSVLKGESHKSVWWSQAHKELAASLKTLSRIPEKSKVQAYATVHKHLVNLKLQAHAFIVPEQALLTVYLNEAYQDLKKIFTAKE